MIQCKHTYNDIELRTAVIVYIDILLINEQRRLWLKSIAQFVAPEGINAMKLLMKNCYEN